MNYSTDFKEWLNKVRFSRNVCMLIPMEASMGYPVVVKHSAEIILPFFKVLSSDSTDKLAPPFAYLRVQYPSAVILTYNNLRTLPEWKNFNWDTTVENNANGSVAPTIEEYYNAICCDDNLSVPIEQLDELLLAVLSARDTGNAETSQFVMWYKKLILEAKKYR